MSEDNGLLGLEDFLAPFMGGLDEETREKFSALLNEF